MARIFVATSYRFNITGLKPGTVHNFFINDVNKNTDVRQVGKNLGESLISDSQGKLDFDLHIASSKELEYLKLLWIYGPGQGLATSFHESAKGGPTTIKVSSADGSSKATMIGKTDIVYLIPFHYSWFQQMGTIDNLQPYHAASSYDSSDGGYCFLPGTMVTMADWSLKSIESIVAGEMVRTINGVGEVLRSARCSLGTNRSIVRVGELLMSDDHPLWTKQGWGTYNYTHFSQFAKGERAIPLTGKTEIASLNGWRELEPIYQDGYGPNTELCHLFVEGGNYICDGLVVAAKLAQIGDN